MFILSDGSQAKQIGQEKKLVLMRTERNGIPTCIIASLVEVSEYRSANAYTIVKACVRYLSLFLKVKCICSLFRTKYIEKKFKNAFVFSSHRFMNIHSRLSYHALPALLKLLVLKKQLYV